MNKYVLIITYSLYAFITGCIGVDIVDKLESSAPQIMISTSIDTLKIGDEYQINATVIDEQGRPLINPSFAWNAITPNTVSINTNGSVIGLSRGEAVITVQFKQLLDSLSFHVGETTSIQSSRKIDFSGKNGYDVDGTGEISARDSEIILEFNADFSADNGPGLVVYLSNNPSSVQGGVELTPLMANSGAQSYNISQILNQNGNNMAVGLSSYDYVIIYCKPFGVTFGVGAIQK
ncbi:MAG: hypothetical protein ACJAT1_000691 [Marivirga sp.]|jgi:hypothetical protein